jgi:hypothetical protein
VLISSTAVPAGAPAKNSVGPSVNRSNYFIVGQARQNHVGTARQFENILRNHGALCSQWIRLGDVSVVDQELVSRIKQALCDSQAHVAQPDKSKCDAICGKKFHKFPLSARQ